MGLADRDYAQDRPLRSLNYQPTPSGNFFGQVSALSVTAWLIGINVAVYILDLLLSQHYVTIIDGEPFKLLEGLGYFSLDLGFFHFQLWRIITCQFIHANGQHLLFNMIGLYFFGPLIENYLGKTRYLAFYLICGIGGSIGYTALWLAHVLGGGAETPMVGASAGIFGVLVAAAVLAPNVTVLVYGVLPVKLRYFALILLGVAVYTVFHYGHAGAHNAGGQAAHLGGAAVGYALIRWPMLLNPFATRYQRTDEYF